jgi:hypothetical protein
MKKLWGTLAALTLLTGCAATPAPAPAPTPDDSVFLTQYRQRFPDGTDAGGVRIGKSICDDYRAGTSFAGEIAYIRSVNPVITAANAGFLIGASTAAYCPEFNNRH